MQTPCLKLFVVRCAGNAAGLDASERRFDDLAVRSARSGADLVGHLNYIHLYRAQVLGVREVAYLTNASAEDRKRRIFGASDARAPRFGLGRWPKSTRRALLAR